MRLKLCHHVLFHRELGHDVVVFGVRRGVAQLRKQRAPAACGEVEPVRLPRGLDGGRGTVRTVAIRVDEAALSAGECARRGTMARENALVDYARHAPQRSA